jgi:hypothetical protein
MPIDPHRITLCLALPLALSACTESPTATTTTPDSEQPPAAYTETAALTETAAGFIVVPLQLRPAEGSELATWGNMLIILGTAPPNPCNESLELATVAVCGVIHNPGGGLLTGGTLSVQTSPDAAPVVLQLEAPPNPCLTYHVRGAAAPDLGFTGLELPAVQVVFNSEQGDIVSAIAGSPESQPGPPNDWGSVIATAPGPPDAPPNPCLITLGGRVG